mmetsp:Transcript_70140/g.209050  ORF Transcript_70140/g.209050 Transcript_70140/m.209050 type:complete len:188 (+) Transcript_70140:431-994(+)
MAVSATVCIKLRLRAGETSRGGTCGEVVTSLWMVIEQPARCTKLSMEPEGKFAERLLMSGEPEGKFAERLLMSGLPPGINSIDAPSPTTSWNVSSLGSWRTGERSLLGAQRGELVEKGPPATAVLCSGCRTTAVPPGRPASRDELLRKPGASTRTVVPGPGRCDQRRRSWPVAPPAAQPWRPSGPHL